MSKSGHCERFGGESGDSEVTNASVSLTVGSE